MRPPSRELRILQGGAARLDSPAYTGPPASDAPRWTVTLSLTEEDVMRSSYGSQRGLGIPLPSMKR